jgi:hypothetical protein
LTSFHHKRIVTFRVNRTIQKLINTGPENREQHRGLETNRHQRTIEGAFFAAKTRDETALCHTFLSPGLHDALNASPHVTTIHTLGVPDGTFIYEYPDVLSSPSAIDELAPYSLAVPRPNFSDLPLLSSNGSKDSVKVTDIPGLAADKLSRISAVTLHLLTPLAYEYMTPLEQLIVSGDEADFILLATTEIDHYRTILEGSYDEATNPTTARNIQLVLRRAIGKSQLIAQGANLWFMACHEHEFEFTALDTDHYQATGQLAGKQNCMPLSTLGSPKLAEYGGFSEHPVFAAQQELYQHQLHQALGAIHDYLINPITRSQSDQLERSIRIS